MKKRFKAKGSGGTWHGELMLDVGGWDKAYEIIDLILQPGAKVEIVVTLPDKKKGGDAHIVPHDK